MSIYLTDFDGWEAGNMHVVFHLHLGAEGGTLCVDCGNTGVKYIFSVKGYWRSAEITEKVVEESRQYVVYELYKCSSLRYLCEKKIIKL